MKITIGKVVAVVVIIGMVAVMRMIDTGTLDLSKFLPSISVGK